MAFDLDQEGQAEVCKVKNWKKDLPGRGHSMGKAPHGERVIREEQSICGEGG